MDQQTIAEHFNAGSSVQTTMIEAAVAAGIVVDSACECPGNLRLVWLCHDKGITSVDEIETRLEASAASFEATFADHVAGIPAKYRAPMSPELLAFIVLAKDA